MKGVVFREFLEFSDRQFGETVTEALIEQADLPSGGAYVATGYYRSEEMSSLVEAACRHAQTPAAGLLCEFGAALGGRFAETHQRFFDEAGELFELLDRIDGQIHVEVRKLYPDAELPRFETVSRDARCMVLDYTSPRRLHNLAKGVIEAAASYYGETIDVSVETFPEDHPVTARISVLRRSP